MRIPGIHVLLTAGVVAVTSIGAVTAFTLTSSEAAPRLADVAPPPAVAAPLDPAPLPLAPPQAPAPAPVIAQEPTEEPVRAAEPEPDTSSDDRDADTPEPRPAPPADEQDDDSGPDRPTKVKPDPNGTKQQKLAYACQNGFFDGPMCKQYR